MSLHKIYNRAEGIGQHYHDYGRLLNGNATMHYEKKNRWDSEHGFRAKRVTEEQ